MTDVQEVITRVHRAEWARVVATLARRFGDLDLAEEMAAEAFATAVAHWPVAGVPPNPGGWLTTTAHRKAIDRLRREAKREEKHQEALMLSHPPEPRGVIDDDRLRLIFTCCHPALAMEARVALTLRMVGGLTVAEIARAFLVQESAMSRRITRAKAKIKAVRIPYRVPLREDLPDRVSGVLAVLYLIFNEGYLASDPAKEAVRGDLTAEAIRLTRLLHELLPTDGEVAGLLALMLLTEARRPARTGPGGVLVPLDEQDRSRWDRDLVAEGDALITRTLATTRRLGPYQLQAAIAAVHDAAERPEDTDWRQIAALYALLDGIAPGPMVTLNRAVAVAMVQGPEAGLAMLEPLDADPRMARHHRLASVRAHLLERAGDHAGALAAYRAAARATTSLPEQRYLLARAGRLAAQVSPG